MGGGEGFLLNDLKVSGRLWPTEVPPHVAAGSPDLRSPKLKFLSYRSKAEDPKLKIQSQSS